MNPITITALILFAATYILMMAFQKIRPYVAIGSALIFIALGTIASASPDLFGSGFFTSASQLIPTASHRLSEKSTGMFL